MIADLTNDNQTMEQTYTEDQGFRPFRGATAYELGAAVLTASPMPLSLVVPGRSRALVARCLAKQPSERFGSATELGAALADL